MGKIKKGACLPPEETALFCGQVAMLLEAGIPLHDGLRTLCETYQESGFYPHFQTLYQTVTETGSLYEAVHAAGLFPEYMTEMVRIGEKSGKLDLVMQALAAYYERESALRCSIKSAVLYPAVLTGMMAVVIAVLVIKVLPVFERVFRSLGADLGASASGTMVVGSTIGTVVLVIVGILLLAVLAAVFLSRTPHREGVLLFLCRVFPFFAGIRKKIAAERFSEVIAMLLAGGYPVEEALQFAQTLMPDPASAEQVKACVRQMETGASFASAVEAAGIYEPLHNKMLTTGAASGQMDRVLSQLSDIYAERADEGIAKAVSLIEPAMVTVLSVVIGGILLSMMLPLLSILSAIGG